MSHRAPDALPAGSTPTPQPVPGDELAPGARHASVHAMPDVARQDALHDTLHDTLHDRLHAVAQDAARLAAVEATGLLDSAVEPAFDRFTGLAHRLLGAPLCLLTLVDRERDFVKSAIGLPEPLASARAIPTGHGRPSFCQYMVATGAPLSVDDARGHPVFGGFSAVAMGAVACAGAPLTAPGGERLGTICVIDFAARAWTAADRDTLVALAEAASAEIALRVEAARAHRAREAREAVLRQFVEHAPAAVAMFDRQLVHLAASRRWQRDFQLDDAPVEGRGLLEVFPDIPSRWIGELAGALSGTEVREPDFTFEGPDGGTEHVRYEIRPWHAADGTVGGAILFAEVITERRRLEARLAHQATHDALTGLPNRALFRERVGRALARRASGRGLPAGSGDHAAVLFVDLDDFKAVNDALGHEAGDRLVRGVATRLLGATRGFDTVARLGGDEFAVLLEGLAGPADAEVVVGRIQRALASPVPLGAWDTAPHGEASDGSPPNDNRPNASLPNGSPPDGAAVAARASDARALGLRAIVTGASIGVAHAAATSTPESLLRDADVAMYRAKAAGKGRHAVFDPAMEDARRARQELEAELRVLLADAEATHPTYGALVLVYQPVVRLDDGTAVSVEALVRWQHPRRGLVSPGAFIPLAEESGLVLALGRWVVRAACRQLAHWEATLPPGHVPAVAVNVSGRQLDDPDLVLEVARTLRATGVAPHRLTLEITETALAGNPDAARDVLTALRALGVRLAIDDFGTGYSSLGYLQTFPVDVLKIDKRFVDGVAAGGSEAALARTIIALAGALGLRTVAEGVEQDGQHAVLRELGCELAQGFLFARPMPGADVDAWLRRSALDTAAAAPAVAAGRAGAPLLEAPPTVPVAAAVAALPPMAG